MKIVVIGGGNMGGAIVRGLVKGKTFRPEDITVIDVNPAPLKLLKEAAPGVNTELNNYDSLKQADIILLAIKPWMIQDAILDIKFKMDYSRQILISIAASVTIKEMESSLKKATEEYALPALFRAIPNTAIAVGSSMTVIASNNATPDQEEQILRIFNEVGTAMIMDEDKLNGGLALTSCGIAFLFRYIRAATEAGVELGFYPKDAKDLLVHTMQGAAELLLNSSLNPEDEIDKVTTPGGLTIRGLNELEANGFSNAIIKGLKACR